MKRQRVVAVASKEAREILRDRLFLWLAFLLPVMLMLLFGFGLSFDVEHVPLAIVDQDHSALSRDYAYRFIGSRYFEFKGYARDERAAGRLLMGDAIRVALLIPPDFQRDLLAGRPAEVQTLIDGTFPYRSETIKGYVTAINGAASEALLARYLTQARGISSGETQALLEPVALQTRYLYDQAVRSTWSIAPKLIMVILLPGMSLLTALGVVREKESGTIYNIYASGVSRAEFLIGKLAPYVAIGTLDAGILWLIARVVFGAPFKGDPTLFLVASVLYVVCTTGIGLLVSITVRTQIAALLVTIVVTVIPAFLYSHLFTPMESLSPAAQAVARSLPAMYYSEVVTGSFLKGVGWALLWPDLAVLTAYAAALAAAGYMLFTKRQRA
jgi:ABC-2 type transport system permease protein/ribosome-dependent ATPase